MFLGYSSPQIEFLWLAVPKVYLFGLIATAFTYFISGFKNENTFLFHRNLWFFIAYLFTLVIISDGNTMMLPPFFSFLVLSILLITTIFPATYQYRKNHNKYSGMLPTFYVLAILGTCLFFEHELYRWSHSEEIAILEENYRKERELDEKRTKEHEEWIKRDIEQMGGMIVDEKKP